MGSGYGSECHLLRYLGRHRELLDARVLTATGGQTIRWLDFGFAPKGTWSEGTWPDAEWKGMDFLPDHKQVKAAWRDFWPQRGNVPNWDAVGLVTMNGQGEWLLVEAKAHLSEMRSSCTAKQEGGLGKIIAALDATKGALQVPPERDWLNGYYQYCNRVASLYFLSVQNVPARVLFLYFVGDRSYLPERDCPSDEIGWAEALRAQAEHVGLPTEHRLADRIHTMFLSVAAT